MDLIDKKYHEDRFLTFQQAQEASRALLAAGLKHVVSQHIVDPKWREAYRSNRPELDGVCWSITIDQYLRMPQIKRLIEICEQFNLTFWIATSGADDVALYLKIETQSAHGGS